MIDQKSIIRMENKLAKLMAEKMGQSHGPFDRRLVKSLRRAPRRVKKAADAFLLARVQNGHPKLMHMTDRKKLRRQFAAIFLYLRGIDVADRRKGLVLSILGSLSFNLLVVLGLLLIWLVWRGFI